MMSFIVLSETKPKQHPAASRQHPVSREQAACARVERQEQKSAAHTYHHQLLLLLGSRLPPVDLTLSSFIATVWYFLITVVSNKALSLSLSLVLPLCLWGIRIHRRRNATRSALHESGATPSLTTARHLLSTPHISLCRPVVRLPPNVAFLEAIFW